MKKFLTLFAVAALFSAVACGEAKKDTSDVEEEAKEMLDEMEESMEEVAETVEESIEEVADSMTTDTTVVEEVIEGGETAE